MVCQNCQQEVQQETLFCPHCGDARRVQTSLRVDTHPSPQPLRMVVAEETQTGLSFNSGQAPRFAPEPSAPPVAPRAPQQVQSGSTSWNPQAKAVEMWALTRALDHYEVLNADENMSDDELRGRVAVLRKRLKAWENHATDAKLQEVGRAGNTRLDELEKAFTDRPAYNQAVKVERHLRAVNRIRKKAFDAGANDKILQSDEWNSLKRAARDEGVTKEEIEGIILELKQQGVLTGVTVAGQEVRTLLELRTACNGRSRHLVEVIWNDELAHWLELACDERELAEKTRQIKAEYEEDRQLGAQLWLWMVGEKRLILPSSNGEEEIYRVQEWVAGVTGGRLREASVEALADGRLEHWFGLALERQELAEHAIKVKAKGMEGIQSLVGLIQAASTGMTARINPFKVGDGAAYSLAEMAALCERFPQEAQRFLFQGRFERWIDGSLGEAKLAEEVAGIVSTYAGEQHKGLELFIRKLYVAEGLAAYPRLFVNPDVIDFGTLPAGAQAYASVTLGNSGRGYVWGEIYAETSFPGLSVPGTFDGVGSELNIQLDTLHVPPGEYAGSLVFQPEGAPESCVVRLRYQVAPLTVNIYPPLIDMGAIPLGKSRSTNLNVQCQPSAGRLVGKASVKAPAHGLSVTRNFDGSNLNLEIKIRTSGLEAGRTYKATVALDTNVGQFQLPVQFHTQLRWDIVSLWTFGVSTTVGLVMLLCRYLLLSADRHFSTWILSYGSQPRPEVLLPSGIFSLFLAGIIWLFIKRRQSKNKELQAPKK
jgi:hypothetical protein